VNFESLRLLSYFAQQGTIVSGGKSRGRGVQRRVYLCSHVGGHKYAPNVGVMLKDCNTLNWFGYVEPGTVLGELIIYTVYKL
jgi:hypothetical protein